MSLLSQTVQAQVKTVHNFQATQGLKTQPVKTMSALEDVGYASASASDSWEAAPAAYPAGYLHEGDTGPQVVTLQTDLTDLGYSPDGIDGIFGPDTLAAVQAFQRAQGLPSYGLVGALTWNALNQALSSSSITNAQDQVNRGNVSISGSALAGLALQYQGYAYVWGGDSPSTGFDCSGFVQWLYGQFGVSLPHSSYAQWNDGTHVSYDQLQPGDIIFFTTEGVFANHVGIYLGNGEFISAATPSQGVVVQSLSEPYFADNYDGAVQIFPSN